MSIKIIYPRSGLKTTDQILEIIQANPQGITIRELSQQLNRPVSLLNHYLKSLVASQQISAKKDNDRWIYTPALLYYSLKK